MKTKYWNILFFILLILDTTYTFNQNMNGSLEGDIPDVVLPLKEYQEVLEDPLGTDILFHHKAYIGAGRFVAHWYSYAYFRTVPFLLQHFVTPIESVYLSSALLKTAIQVLFIALIAAFVYFLQEKKHQNLWISMVLIAPLFQIEGYSRYMSVIAKSIIYFFFYGFPLFFLAIYFLFFFKPLYNKEKTDFNIPTFLFLLLLSFALSMSGPLVPGTVLIACPMVLLCYFATYYQTSEEPSFFQKIYTSILKIDRSLLILFSFFCLFCLYALFLGIKGNAAGITQNTPLLDRYMKMPLGLYYTLFTKLGFPLLLGLIGLNIFLLTKQKDNIEAQKLLSLAKWIGIFAIIYLLLLPLGGSRVYRPNIVRGDTFMPITICLIFIYAATSHFLINLLSANAKKIYLAVIFAFLCVFTIADEPVKNTNICEKEALSKIANSTESVVLLDSDCPIMAWNKFSQYEQSIAGSMLLQYWGITKKQTLFYHVKP